MLAEERIGKKNNRLTVKGVTRDNRGIKVLVCACDCGNTTQVQLYNFDNGKVKSCGCYSNDFQKMRSEKAYYKDRLHNVWGSMKERCRNKNNTNYKNYGGRGISVCDEWLDYNTFKDWAYKNGYDDNAEFGECTLDRIDPNRNYCPENCRWITIKEQATNKRPSSEWNTKLNKFHTINGVTKKYKEWLDYVGVSPQFVRYRMNVKGMSFEQALFSKKQQGVPIR